MSSRLIVFIPDSKCVVCLSVTASACCMFPAAISSTCIMGGSSRSISKGLCLCLSLHAHADVNAETCSFGSGAGFECILTEAVIEKLKCLSRVSVAAGQIKQVLISSAAISAHLEVLGVKVITKSSYSSGR